MANTRRFDRRQITDNLEASCSLIEVAAAAGATAFVGIGSQGEYGADTPMHESQLPAPTTLYGAAKVAALFLTRQLAAQTGMRHAWPRLFSTYGPDDNDGWVQIIGQIFANALRPESPEFSISGLATHALTSTLLDDIMHKRTRSVLSPLDQI